MFILLTFVACSEEPEVLIKEPVVQEVKEEAPQPDPEPSKEIKEEVPPPVAEPEAPPPEPVLLNALDPNVNLPVYRHKNSGCYVLVPTGQNDGTLNPVYQRIPTDCPDAMQWESWDNCREGEVWQIGDACECRILVGQPRPDPVSIECPKAPEPVNEDKEDSEAP